MKSLFLCLMKNQLSNSPTTNTLKLLAKIIMIGIVAIRLNASKAIAQKSIDTTPVVINLDLSSKIKNTPEYWIEKLKNTDNFLEVSFELEAWIRDIPDSTLNTAKENYDNLFKNIQQYLNNNIPQKDKYTFIEQQYCGSKIWNNKTDTVEYQDQERVNKFHNLVNVSDTEKIDRLYQWMIIAQEIRMYATRDYTPTKNKAKDTPLGLLLHESGDWQELCTPSTALALSFAKKLGIENTQIAYTNHHIFLHDKEVNMCIDFTRHTNLINTEEAKEFFIQIDHKLFPYSHDGLYTLPPENIVGAIAGNLYGLIDGNTPESTKKRNMLFDYGLYLQNPIIQEAFHYHSITKGNNEQDTTKKEELYKIGLENLLRMTTTPYNYILLQHRVIETYLQLANIQTDSEQKIIYFEKALEHLYGLKYRDFEREKLILDLIEELK